MGSGRARSAGFSLIEAFIGLLVAGLLVGGGYLYIGRKIVEDSDSIKAAKAAGYQQASVVHRQNFSLPFGACGTDFVTFRLLATKPTASPVTIMVCCPSWHGTCELVQ